MVGIVCLAVCSYWQIKGGGAPPIGFGIFFLVSCLFQQFAVCICDLMTTTRLIHCLPLFKISGFATVYMASLHPIVHNDPIDRIKVVLVVAVVDLYCAS